MDLYMTFVDLTKAFVTVGRESLWEIMAKFGCPTKFIANGEAVPRWYACTGPNDGEFSDPFPVANGVKHGCVLAPTVQLDVLCHAHSCFPG